jgi:DNA-binding response OmpR family regulator
MKAPLPKTMLIIEDDLGLLVTLADAAAALGYEARTSASVEEGVAFARAFKPTLVFCDVHLAKDDGREVLKQLRADETTRDCQFVQMTGDWVGASKRESIEMAADAYLAKPFTIKEFAACAAERYRQANL